MFLTSYFCSFVGFIHVKRENLFHIILLNLHLQSFRFNSFKVTFKMNGISRFSGTGFFLFDVVITCMTSNIEKQHVPV